MPDPAGPPPTPAARWLARLAPAIVLVSVAVVFMPALTAGYVYWDDHLLIARVSRFVALSDEALGWMFSTSYAGHFQPLTWLSYWLDLRLYGPDPLIFHATNVALHALTAMAFYFLAHRLIAAGTRPALGRHHVTASALFAAALFAVHPLRVESVAWIAERRDVLSGFFFVLSLVCYIRYTAGRGEAPAGTPLGGRRLEAAVTYGGSILFFVLSLLAKAAAVTTPAALLVLDLYPLSRRRPGPGRSSWTALLLEKLPFLAIAALFSWRAIVAQDRGGALYDLATHDLRARIGQAVYGLAFYPLKTVFPFALTPLYEIPAREDLLGMRLLISGAVLMIAAIAAISLVRRLPAVPAALATFALLVAPVLGFFQSGPQLVADRYTYLPGMSFAILGGAALQWIRGTSWWRSSTSGRSTATVAAFALVVFLSHLTFRYCGLWDNPRALWRHAVRLNPDSPIAHTNLADAYARNGPEAFEGAIHHYTKALQLNPRDPVALAHLAIVAEQSGLPAKAIPLYARSLSIDPTRLDAALALARLLAEAGRVDQAVAVLEDAARRNPDSPSPADHLAELLTTHPDPAVRDPAKALVYAEQASAARDHRHPLALLNLATALAQAGRFDQAVQRAELARSIAAAAGDSALTAEIERRLNLFREGLAYPPPPLPDAVADPAPAASGGTHEQSGPASHSPQNR